MQFEPFRAWFFVFRTDDYRVFASICVLGVASLLLFYLAPNDALLNGKKTYDTKKRIYQSGLVLHFALCVCAILIIRWWFALILVAIGTAVIPAYEKWVANYYHQETVVITPKSGSLICCLVWQELLPDWYCTLLSQREMTFFCRTGTVLCITRFDPRHRHQRLFARCEGPFFCSFEFTLQNTIYLLK